MQVKTAEQRVVPILYKLFEGKSVFNIQTRYFSLQYSLFWYIIDCNCIVSLSPPSITNDKTSVKCAVQCARDNVCRDKEGLWRRSEADDNVNDITVPAENGLRFQSQKTPPHALFKVVQLPRGSQETEVAVLIVFFCGEIIIIMEMRERCNVLLNFPLRSVFSSSPSSVPLVRSLNENYLRTGNVKRRHCLFVFD